MSQRIRNKPRRLRPALFELEAREVPAVVLGGLKATYFDNDRFTGPSISRTDATVDFDWKGGGPLAGYGTDTFSVRWSGVVVPKFSEAYTFHAYSDDGVRVWVNGRLVVNNWDDHSPAESTGTVALTAGQAATIRIDYKESYGGAVMKLSWSSASQAKEVIPADRLGTGRGVPVVAPPPTTPPVTETRPPVTTAPPTTSGPTLPAAPSGLKATAAGTAVQLAWTDNSIDEIGFQVERSLDGLNWAAVATAGAGKTAYTDGGLPAGTAVSYRVRAVNAAGPSDASNAATATTATATPAPAPAPAPTNVVYVSNLTEFRTAVRAAVPGTTILLRAGVYGGDSWFANVQGTADKPIVIAAADAANPPIFRGGSDGMHFVDCAYLELRNLVFEGQGDNGLNIDDNGTFDTPAHDILLSGLVVRNIGPTGNRDGIKLSGVDRVAVENCTITAWGSGGSGIDMVGCHDATVIGCTFANGGNDVGNAVQVKGGSARVAVRNNRFENAGSRAVQLGGYSDLWNCRYLPGESGYEVKDATVEGNVIIGSESAVAFVNVDSATVRYNTISDPTKYVFRILQETTGPGYVPCRNGMISDNLIAFNAGTLQTAVNVGTGTAPDTFQFARNWWYAADRPASSTPTLPTAEANGSYGVDPQFVNAAAGDLHLAANSPAVKVGAYALIG